MTLQGESRIRKAAVKVVQTVRHVGQTARSLRFVLPLAAGLIISSCGPCQETQKEGVKPMGDSEQKIERKNEQKKGTVFMPKDSTFAKADSAKADSLRFIKSIEQREKAEKEGRGIITEKDKKPRIIR